MPLREANGYIRVVFDRVSKAAASPSLSLARNVRDKLVGEETLVTERSALPALIIGASLSLQMRVHGSFLPAHGLRRWHPSSRCPATILFPCLLDAAAAATSATAAAVRMRRREIKLRPHRRRRGAVRVRVWRRGEAVSAHGQNAADASHVRRLQLQRHAALRP